MEEPGQELHKNLKQEGKVGESNWLNERQWVYNILGQTLNIYIESAL